MMSISIQQQIEYALMTGASYISNRDPKNQFPIPEGWAKARVGRKSETYSAG